MLTLEQNRIALAARREVDNRRTAAGWDGSMHDNGAGALDSIVDAWICGLKGTIPLQLIPFQKQAAQEADPEWAEYQRLNNKFG